MKKRKLSPPSSFIVTQSNKLVEARYNLPLGEQRLILTMIGEIQPEDEDFKEYRVDVKAFAEFLDIDKNSVYREFHKIQKSIVSRVLVIYESDGPLAVGWVSSAKYLDREGAVLLSFDPKLRPYLLQLKGNFTCSNLDMLLSFKSQYTMRVYNLLKQYESLGERHIDIETLRDMLGMRSDQYLLYSNFKNRILEPVKNELYQKADIYFDYQEIKYGRRVGAIRFQIFVREIVKAVDTQSKVAVAPGLSLLDELLLLVPEAHRSKKTVRSALALFRKQQGVEYVRRNILYCNAKAEKSYAGFLSNALKHDWGHDWMLEAAATVNKQARATEVWQRQGFASQKAYDDFMYCKQMNEYGKRTNEYN